MEVQLKKGFLEICVLAVLKKEDSYGYKIIKDLFLYMEISESTLYTILRRLENCGHITVYNVECNNRVRKYYSITQLGSEKIKDFLNEWNQLIKLYNFIKESDSDE